MLFIQAVGAPKLEDAHCPQLQGRGGGRALDWGGPWQLLPLQVRRGSEHRQGPHPSQAPPSPKCPAGGPDGFSLNQLTWLETLTKAGLSLGGWRIAKDSEPRISFPFDALPSPETAPRTHRICSRPRQEEPHFTPTPLPHFLASPRLPYSLPYKYLRTFLKVGTIMKVRFSLRKVRDTTV